MSKTLKKFPSTVPRLNGNFTLVNVDAFLALPFKIFLYANLRPKFISYFVSDGPVT